MTVLTKIFKTHIGKIRASHSDQMDEICSLLDITKSGYCWHQYKQYEKFLSIVCNDYTNHLEKLRYSSTFRGFWNNEWAQRNEIDFMPFAYESKYDKKEIMKEYVFIHSADRLFHDEDFYNRFDNILKLI